MGCKCNDPHLPWAWPLAPSSWPLSRPPGRPVLCPTPTGLHEGSLVPSPLVAAARSLHDSTTPSRNCGFASVVALWWASVWAPRSLFYPLSLPPTLVVHQSLFDRGHTRWLHWVVTLICWSSDDCLVCGHASSCPPVVFRPPAPRDTSGRHSSATASHGTLFPEKTFTDRQKIGSEGLITIYLINRILCCKLCASNIQHTL
jgi:hypothetical protein